MSVDVSRSIVKGKKILSIRRWIHQLYTNVLYRRGQLPAIEELRRPAIIFSPHQDDETLGCGGTIAKKVEAGAEIVVVFMTDGRQSHSHLISPERLVEIRRDEAVAACRVLGVPESMVSFLDFPDGNLFGCFDEAVKNVGEILSNSAATDIYLPFSGEPTDDHRATHAIVRKALAEQKRSYNVFEYSVWFWHHWPWVNLYQSSQPAGWFVIRNTIQAVFGLRLLFRFRFGFPVKTVQERKLAALNEHKSQMTRLIDSPAWLTLHDVADGDFLRNALQDYEFYYQYVYTPVEAAG